MNSVYIAIIATMLLIVFFALSFGFGMLHTYSQRVEAIKRSQQQLSEYVRAAQIDQVIEDVLSDIVSIVEGVTRSRLTIVADHQVIDRNIVIRRLDDGSVAVLRNSGPPPVTAVSFTNWGDLRDDFNAGRCRVVSDINQLTVESFKERLRGLSLGGFVACPLRDNNQRFYGAIFAGWSTGQPPPSDFARVQQALEVASARVTANFFPR